MIHAGNYKARAIDHQFGLAGTDTEQVAVTFEITEEGEFHGHTIAWFGFFTEATAERTVQALRTCGWDGDDLSDLRGLDRNEVVLVIEHDEYNGKVQARVKWINRAGAGRIELKRKMTDAQKVTLARRLKGLVLATKPRDAVPSAERGGYPPSWDNQGL